MARHRLPAAERFWAKVEKTEGCWLWQGSINPDGYGQIWVGDTLRMAKAHRFSYQLHKGEISEGLEIDHLCKVRRCVNPDHLDLVTHRENLLRGDTFQARNAAKTQCPKGHAYTPENTYVPPAGGRRCRACGKRPNARIPKAPVLREALSGRYPSLVLPKGAISSLACEFGVSRSAVSFQLYQLRHRRPRVA